jgi:hypothetical protein
VGTHTGNHLDRLDAITGLGDDFDVVGEFQQLSQSFTHQCLIVDQRNANHGCSFGAGTQASMMNPRPCAASTVKRPPTSSRR